MAFKLVLKLFTVLALVSTAIAIEGKAFIEDSNVIGWKGELPSSVHAEFTDSTQELSYGELGNEVWNGRIEQVSWKPRAFVFHNFLSEEECDHLKTLGGPSLHKSTVVDSKTGKSVDSDVRTSSGTFLSYQQDEVVARIEKRIAHVTMIPEENGESLQILKYVDGQEYRPHTDYFHDKFNTDPTHGGQRIATVLMYLATPEEGGETVFPYAETKVSGPEWSDCALKGLAVKAIKGNALFFYSLKPDASEDSTSTHGSCPTLKGEKWSATKWIHINPFNLGKASASLCEDGNDKCIEWAASGECDRNPGYMKDVCKKACNSCDGSASSSGKLGNNRKSKILT